MQIKLEFTSNEYGTSDTANALALPSRKRETKIIADKKEKTRFLSKAQRKRLEKIVDKKKKKENVSLIANICISALILSMHKSVIIFNI